MLGAVAQGIAIGEKAGSDVINSLRKAGKIALPQDLGIDPAKANRKLLAAQSMEELVEWSGGLYQIPEKFRK